MSDANESEWSNKSGRKSASAGMTKGASVSSGLSEHGQISDNCGINAHGQGQRPKTLKKGRMSHGGKTFNSHG